MLLVRERERDKKKEIQMFFSLNPAGEREKQTLLNKRLYKKLTRNLLMKLTASVNFINMKKLY